MGLNPVHVESKTKEFFASDIGSLLTDLIQESMDYVGKPSSLMNKEEKVYRYSLSR